MDEASATYRRVSFGSFSTLTYAADTDFITVYSDGFLPWFGATNSVHLDGGILPDGLEWRPYTFTWQGVGMAMLITAVKFPDATVDITTVIAPPHLRRVTIGTVQQEFTLTSDTTVVPLLAGIDPVLVTRQLGGSPTTWTRR